MVNDLNECLRMIKAIDRMRKVNDLTGMVHYMHKDYEIRVLLCEFSEKISADSFVETMKRCRKYELNQILDELQAPLIELKNYMQSYKTIYTSLHRLGIDLNTNEAAGIKQAVDDYIWRKMV